MNIKYYCIISVHAFDHLILRDFYTFMFKITRVLNVRLNGPIRLPTKIRKITLLRSPHIDKKSREQFELQVHKQIFLINFSNISSLVLFKFLLKTKTTGLYIKSTTISCVNSSIG